MPKRKTAPRGSRGLTPTEDLDEALQHAPIVIQNYIQALEAENLKAQEQIVKFKAESISHKNRAAALEKKLEEAHGTTFEELIFQLDKQESETNKET